MGVLTLTSGYWVFRISSSLLGPVVPSFRALARRLKFTVRRHKFTEDSLSLLTRGTWVCGGGRYLSFMLTQHGERDFFIDNLLVRIYLIIVMLS